MLFTYKAIVFHWLVLFMINLWIIDKGKIKNKNKYSYHDKLFSDDCLPHLLYYNDLTFHLVLTITYQSGSLLFSTIPLWMITYPLIRIFLMYYWIRRCPWLDSSLPFPRLGPPSTFPPSLFTFLSPLFSYVFVCLPLV